MRFVELYSCRVRGADLEMDLGYLILLSPEQRLEKKLGTEAFATGIGRHGEVEDFHFTSSSAHQKEAENSIFISGDPALDSRVERGCVAFSGPLRSFRTCSRDFEDRS